MGSGSGKGGGVKPTAKVVELIKYYGNRMVLPSASRRHLVGLFEWLASDPASRTKRPPVASVREGQRLGVFNHSRHLSNTGKRLEVYLRETDPGLVSREPEQVSRMSAVDPDVMIVDPGSVEDDDVYQFDDISRDDEGFLLGLPKPDMTIKDRGERRRDWVVQQIRYVRLVREAGFDIPEEMLPKHLRGSEQDVVDDSDVSGNGHRGAKRRHHTGQRRSDGFVYKAEADQSGVPEGYHRCRYCEEVLADIFFPYDKRRMGYSHNAGCKNCKKRNYRKYISWARSNPADFADDIDNELLTLFVHTEWGRIPAYKRCGCNFVSFHCGNRVWPASNFKRNSYEKTGLSSYCRDCTRHYKRFRTEVRDRYNTPMDRGTYL